MTTNISRRQFLKTSSAASAALLIGFNAKGALATQTSTHSVEFNPFIKINTDGTVTAILKHFEMGQGTTTGLTTLIAEELDISWDKITPEFAPADNTKYKNLFFGVQGSGGSTAIANSFMQYRQAGAAAKAVLIEAAAQKWNIDPENIKIEAGLLSSGRHAGHFGEFLDIAAHITPPATPKLKSPQDFKLIGQQKLTRKDNDSKTNGSAIFAMDISLENMVYVAVKHSPKFGGKAVSVNINSAQHVTGFIDAKIFPDKSGVAVYAKNTWAAFQAKDALKVSWDFTQAETRSSHELYRDAKAQLISPEYNVTKEIQRSEIKDKIKASAQTFEVEYEFPFLNHAQMEPLNCVIEPTETGVRFHDGCQIPTLVQNAVGAYLGLSPEQVEVNTVYAGGSFGRRATSNADYQTEAAMAFDMIGRDRPVKLVYSREDDIQAGYYRPMAMHKASIGLDNMGNITGWSHDIVAKSILKGTIFEQFLVKEGVDETSVEGINHSLYQLPNLSLGLSDFKTEIPVLWWRSVGHTHTAFTMETLLDQVAEKAKKDPIDLRLELLNNENPMAARMAHVIKAVRKASNWDQKNGRILGIASHFSFNTYVATVAEITVDQEDIHVAKLYVAVDCGVPINPDIIRAQMEGGSGYGLGAILRNEITLSDGEIDQSNFPDYEPLRMFDMPAIDVTIIESNEAPTGVGEPAVPPVGPAVANAIYNGTGKRITSLPFTKSGLNFI